MPYDVKFASGRYTGLFISDVQSGAAVAPTAETITVATAGAAAGALTIPVNAITNPIYRGKVLKFSNGVEAILTADAAAGATSLTVDNVSGTAGAGISGAIAAGVTASNDRLWRLLGTSSSNYTVNENNVQQLQSTTYETVDSMSWDTSEAASKGWQIPRQGRFKSDDRAFRQVFTAAHNDKELWVRYILPQEDGAAGLTITGRVKVRNFDAPSPADGITDANFTLVGQGEPVRVWND